MRCADLHEYSCSSINSFEAKYSAPKQVSGKTSDWAKVNINCERLPPAINQI